MRHIPECEIQFRMDFQKYNKFRSNVDVFYVCLFPLCSFSLFHFSVKCEFTKLVHCMMYGSFVLYVYCHIIHIKHSVFTLYITYLHACVTVCRHHFDSLNKAIASYSISYLITSASTVETVK